MTLPARPEEIPWDKREFLGWRDPKAPGRAYLVLPYGGEVIGLALRAAPAPKSRLRSNICGFCTTTHGLADITLFSGKRAGKSGREGNTLRNVSRGWRRSCTSSWRACWSPVRSGSARCAPSGPGPGRPSACAAGTA
ncbi:FBP domain-containing protein [Amycolatopsis sp. NPDC051128]|uniref:FBP domain-containing protein n=1 Tax=Amycolatopsis sp. NPDC051128 TaxID=3155412 RepID=UPI00341F9A3D